ncbi:MAG: hypothetical protein KKH83_08490 [Candidatus Margulisbacteria bacterium]|nr:hypothetical protein [Candidatus Margulisiibacteriota bacterium]
MKNALLYFVVLFAIAGLVLSGCGKSTTDVVTVDIFPSETGLSLAYLESLGPSSSSVDADEGDDYSTAVNAIGTVASNILDNDDSLFNNIFTLLGAIEEKLATNTVTKTFTMTLDGASKAVSVDFSDFDFDGDGALEGSSGTASFTDGKPVTVRIWIDSSRALCGLLTTATEGAMYVKPNAFSSAKAADLQFKAVYNMDDDKEITVQGSGTVATGMTISSGEVYAHYEPTLEVTFINSNYDFSAHPSSYTSLTAITRFDTTKMKATTTANGVATMTDQGVDLTTGLGMTVTEDKYDISGIALVDNTNSVAHAQWPAAFSATPSF